MKEIFSPGTMLKEHYEIKSFLGKGGMGKTSNSR